MSLLFEIMYSWNVIIIDLKILKSKIYFRLIEVLAVFVDFTANLCSQVFDDAPTH